MQQQIALLITPVASAKALAALSKLAEVGAAAFATEHGAVLVLDDVEYGASRAAAGQISAALRGVELILLRRGPSEDPADSDVQAVRYAQGKMGDKLAPGLIISGLDPLCERLILGSITSAELAAETAVVRADSLSKFAAMRALASGRKKKS